MQYQAIIERTATGYSGYVPDVPGCVAIGATIEEARRHLEEALQLHIEGLLEDGEPIPPPNSQAVGVHADVAAA